MISVVIPPVSALPLTPQGMDKSGDFNLGVGSTFVQIPTWVARSTYSATITSDALVIPRSGTANIFFQVTWDASSATSRQIRIKKNGTVIGTTSSSGTHSALTVSLSSVALAASDALTVWPSSWTVSSPASRR